MDCKQLPHFIIRGDLNVARQIRCRNPAQGTPRLIQGTVIARMIQTPARMAMIMLAKMISAILIRA